MKWVGVVELSGAGVMAWGFGMLGVERCMVCIVEG